MHRDANTHAPRPFAREDGVATILVMFVFVVISVVLVVVVENSRRTSQSARQLTQRLEGGTGAESAARTVQAGLVAGLIDFDTNDFTLTGTELASIVTSEGGNILPNSSSVYADLPGQPIVRIPGATASAHATLWQVVSVLAPHPDGNPTVTDVHPTNLVVYVRTWKQRTNVTAAQAASGASRPEYKRIEFRQGTLADYQILSDAPIQLDDGLTINGRIHSNGFNDGVQRPPSTHPGARIWQRSASPLTCTTTTNGVPPTLSTGTGSIAVTAPGCRIQEHSDKFVDVAKADDQLTKLGDPCSFAPSGGMATSANGQIVYHCNRGTVDPNTGIRTATVNLGISPYSVVHATTHRRTHVFNNDVRVSGTSTSAGRVTIATFQQTTAPIPPDIIVSGNILHGTRGTTTPARNVGLVSAGNIVIDPSTCAGGGARNIQAAMVAMTGGITIGTQWATQVRPPGALPQCGQLTIDGALASHLAMSLRWQWSAAAVDWVGFSSRNIRWDETLGRYAPPSYPLGDPFEIVSVRTANADCQRADGTWRAIC